MNFWCFVRVVAFGAVLTACGSSFSATSDTDGNAGHSSSGGDTGGGAFGAANGGVTNHAGEAATAGGTATAGGSSGAAGGGASGGEPSTGGEAGASQTPTICDRSGWVASAFGSSTIVQGAPANALDGDVQTRWTGGVPQEVGQWFAVELTPPQLLSHLSLDDEVDKGDQPTEVGLELNGVGTPTTTTTSATAIDLEFTPTLTHSLKITVKMPSAQMVAGTLPWWSIDELNADCAVVVR